MDRGRCQRCDPGGARLVAGPPTVPPRPHHVPPVLLTLSRPVAGGDVAMPESPLVIGWKERIDFPDWKLRRVKVKIDTGARTSAVGAVYYELRDEPGVGRVA